MIRKKYPAVTIASVDLACAAAKAQDGRRILATEAPRLPLADCSQPHDCRCRFRKYDDRRNGDEPERRHHRASMRSALYAGGDRRRPGGRRHDD